MNSRLNIEHNLVLIKDEDQTSKIRYCEFSNGEYNVTYTEGKVYSYRSNNITWLKNPTNRDPSKTVVSVNNQPISNISKILLFQDKYIRLIFKSGRQKLYKKGELVI